MFVGIALALFFVHGINAEEMQCYKRNCSFILGWFDGVHPQCSRCTEFCQYIPPYCKIVCPEYYELMKIETIIDLRFKATVCGLRMKLSRTALPDELELTTEGKNDGITYYIKLFLALQVLEILLQYFREKYSMYKRRRLEQQGPWQ